MIVYNLIIKDLLFLFEICKNALLLYLKLTFFNLLRNKFIFKLIIYYFWFYLFFTLILFFKVGNINFIYYFITWFIYFQSFIFIWVFAHFINGWWFLISIYFTLVAT